MKTYHQNGTVSEVEYVLDNESAFAIQYDRSGEYDIIFYPGDNVIREIDSELVRLYNRFVNLYFSDLSVYYQENEQLPIGLAQGGHDSNIDISKEQFLELAREYETKTPDIYRHIYVGDCQYLVSTVQNLLQSAEYCFVQYYMQIAGVKFRHWRLGDHIACMSNEAFNTTFFVETFFTKLASILDLMVKIIYEMENPVSSFPSLAKLKSSDKLWGARKQINLYGLKDTIFEECDLLNMVYSIRNEAVHNGTWEFRPKVFLAAADNVTVERYMLFPDFENGHLATAKNRRHFFSEGIKVNDVLVPIHNEFYQRLLATLQYINRVKI